MEKVTYRPQNVCPVAISFDLDGDTVHNISFSGGCSGNLKAISKLLEGKTVDEIETALKGNTCGNKDVYKRQVCGGQSRRLRTRDDGIRAVFVG